MLKVIVIVLCFPSRKVGKLYLYKSILCPNYTQPGVAASLRHTTSAPVHKVRAHRVSRSTASAGENGGLVYPHGIIRRPAHGLFIPIIRTGIVRLNRV